MRKLVLLGLLLTAVCAYAAPVNMSFVAFRPAGWQVGYPYIVTVNGLPAAVMCDDWVHGGVPGDLWQANFTDLGTGNLSLLRFNQTPNALTLYDEAGWLLLRTRSSGPGQWMDINYAVWHIFDASAPLPGHAQGWLTLAQQAAILGFPGVDFHLVGIYTPVNQYDPNPQNPQEFLALLPLSPIPETVVPEPTSLVLMVGGLAGLLARKKLL